MSSSTNPGYVYVDTETTGFGPRDRVVQIAMVFLDEHMVIKDAWGTYLDPRMRFIPGYQVHRITADMLRGAPTFREAAADITRRIGTRTLVAHNLAFDRRMIDQELARCWLPPMPNEGICTLALAKRVVPKPAKYTLADLCRRFDVPLGDAHDARVDALAGARLLPLLQAAANARDSLPATSPPTAPAAAGGRWSAHGRSGGLVVPLDRWIAAL